MNLSYSLAHNQWILAVVIWSQGTNHKAVAVATVDFLLFANCVVVPCLLLMLCLRLIFKMAMAAFLYYFSNK